MEYLNPASKIANLKAGEVVAKVAEDAIQQYDGKHQSSTYYYNLNIDVQQVIDESKKYMDLPLYFDFGSEEEKERVLMGNFRRVRGVDGIIE